MIATPWPVSAEAKSRAGGAVTASSISRARSAGLTAATQWRRRSTIRARTGATWAVILKWRARSGSGGGSLENALEAAHPLFDLGNRVGIGKAHEALATLSEGGTGQCRHPGLVEESIGEPALVQAGPGDVGEDVEGTERTVAAHARHGVEQVDDHVPAALELGHHRLHGAVRLGRAERFDRRHLGEGGGAGAGIDHQ